MSTIYLTGILDNGTKRALLVPSNPRQPIHLTKGGTCTIQFKAIYPTGTAVNLTGATLVLSVKTNSDDSNDAVSLAGTLVNGLAGTATFAFASDTCKYLDPGRYVYDIWMTLGGERNALIPISALFLEPSVTAVP